MSIAAEPRRSWRGGAPRFSPARLERLHWRGVTAAVSTLVLASTLAAGVALGVTAPSTSPVAAPVASGSTTQAQAGPLQGDGGRGAARGDHGHGGGRR